jgi:hypothetical protein
MSILFTRRSFGIAAIVAIPVAVFAASPVSKTVDKETGPAVGLFEAMASGDIEVTVVAKDAKEGMLTVKNKANKPLTIKLPEAFAAVPVLAQRGGARGGAGGMGGMGGGMGGMGGMQGMGGGMMGGGMGGMGGGMMGGGMGGGGMFSVAPEKVAKGAITLVCLDHGLKDPNPHVPYKLIPLESYAKNAEVTEVVKMLARGELDQHSAQAAAWHLQNGLTWEELTNKIGAKHLNGSVEPYFNAVNLQRALAASQAAKERAEKLPEQQKLSTATPAVTPFRSSSEDLATKQ